MDKSLTEQSNLYTKQLVHKKILVPFHELQKNVEEMFMNYADKYIINKCSKEGYISNKKFNVISYSAGATSASNIEYDVVFEFHVCLPSEGMIMDCKIESVTKIGIKAILSHDDKENPVVVFASQLHNPSIFDYEDEDNDSENKFKEGSLIKIKVVGHRFEINDPSIYVLGEII